LKIDCLHGYYYIREDKAGEIAKFNSLYDQSLTPKDDYYTFGPLIDLPDYSITGKLFGTLIATETYYGPMHEIFRANGFVYNFVIRAMAPILISGNYFKPVDVGEYMFSEGLVIPGSYRDDSRKITGYSCRFDTYSYLYKYTQFYYD
jgi:hypothetical protein